MEDTVTTSRSIKATGLKWLEVAPISWKSTTDEYKCNGGSLQELSDWLDQVAVRCVRLSGYLEARGAIGCGDNGHSEGVKRSNRKAARVRKAIGYTIPKQDIYF